MGLRPTSLLHLVPRAGARTWVSTLQALVLATASLPGCFCPRLAWLTHEAPRRPCLGAGLRQPLLLSGPSKHWSPLLRCLLFDHVPFGQCVPSGQRSPCHTGAEHTWVDEWKGAVSSQGAGTAPRTQEFDSRHRLLTGSEAGSPKPAAGRSGPWRAPLLACGQPPTHRGTWPFLSACMWGEGSPPLFS